MPLVNSSGLNALVNAAWSPPDEFDEFRIVRSLGFGAWGQVYLAHDLLLERLVAVKFVYPARDPAARARVLEEARAIARLQHPNVVAIYRVAEFAEHPYLVYEYVHGRALNELERPRPWRQVVDIALDLTRGLAVAHRRGVLHRDVKPANVILTDEGRAKLLDFGLALILDRRNADESAVMSPSQRRGSSDRIAATPAARSAEAVDIPREPRDDSSHAYSPRPDPGYLVGTPMYMAPEVWRGDSATRRSDLYSLGILLYELLAGAAPHRDVPISELAVTVQEREIPRLAEAAPSVEPALAAVVDRLIQRDPAARFPSADALVVALEDCIAPASTDGHPGGNPYRGLAAFESTHASLFFGRRSEIRELVDRVRAEAFVVVGGDSGTGKSSLCRAGVLPVLAKDGWSCVEVVPGRHPVRSLAAALAPWTGTDEAALVELLRDSPDAVARAIRQHALTGGRAATEPKLAPSGETPESIRLPRRRLALFVDQLEELLTLADAGEARVVATAIAALAVRSPSVRVLTTARSDFLSRLAVLPGLGEEMARALYFLRPLTGEHIREVIVRPAAALGVGFESEALIDTLVAQTEHAPGGLPLLQFTLAELWDARDVTARTIRAESLTTLGGVGGALTRHADRLIAGLGGDEQDAVRRILLRLVTEEGTRTRRSKAELLSAGPAQDAERSALEVLVRGRVLVANNTEDGAYEIAHEALLTSWSTLQGWLQRDAANQVVRERIQQAASWWERMGRPRDLLWGARQLADAKVLDRADLGPREIEFLDACGRAIRTQRMIIAGGATALVVGAVVVGLAIWANARRELEARVAVNMQEATTVLADARRIARQRDVVRSTALGLFDGGSWSEAEEEWATAEALALREASKYRAAMEHLDSVVLLDPSRAGLRRWIADVAFERLLRVTRDHRRDLADELESRLTTYDDGRHKATLVAPARVDLTITPPTAKVWIERDNARHILGTTPLSETLQPGLVVLSFEAPGHVTARLPILLAPGEKLVLAHTLPTVASAPPGMLYVPPGRFLFGSTEGTSMRRGFLSTAPLHEVWTDGYFIGRFEVTFAEWIEFLDDLPPAERRRRRPQLSTASTFELTEIGPRRWRFTMKPSQRLYTAVTGERLRYEQRRKRAEQDWTKFPVSSVSYDDVLAFAAWLDRTRRLPGARPCTEYEWERAARGADGRTFPNGDTLAPDDANIDVTYGREPLAYGPDEVGSHPDSRSPVGAEDMAGNAWEFASSILAPEKPVVRGGSWYIAEISARSMNREYSEPTMRASGVGVRLCATRL
jgi:eukaryotic-like serine/threonine-protein kinase